VLWQLDKRTPVPRASVANDLIKRLIRTKSAHPPFVSLSSASRFAAGKGRAQAMCGLIEQRPKSAMHSNEVAQKSIACRGSDAHIRMSRGYRFGHRPSRAQRAMDAPPVALR